MNALTALACLMMAVAFLWLSVEFFATYDEPVLGAVFVVAFLLGVGLTIIEAILPADEAEED